MRVVSKSKALFVAENRPWAQSLALMVLMLYFAHYAMLQANLGAGLMSLGFAVGFFRYAQFTQMRVDMAEDRITLVTRGLFGDNVEHYPLNALQRVSTQPLDMTRQMPFDRLTLEFYFRWGRDVVPVTAGYFASLRMRRTAQELNAWLGLQDIGSHQPSA